MERYPEFHKRDWGSNWTRTAGVATADDGSWGLRLTNHGGPVLSSINDHFAPLFAGQNCMTTEKLWDMMRRDELPVWTAYLLFRARHSVGEFLNSAQAQSSSSQNSSEYRVGSLQVTILSTMLADGPGLGGWGL